MVLWPEVLRLCRANVQAARQREGKHRAGLGWGGDQGTHAVGRGADRHRGLEGVGPVPVRAPVGDGPRGLQRERRRLELPDARPGALARLPLGRGRHRRRLRRAPAAVPGAGAMERRRPDSQGADVRAHEQRGQPRRGRQGVLVLPRQHAHALLPEVPVQVSAAGVPVRGPGGREWPPRPPRLRVRAAGHGDLRRRPLLRRRGRVREGGAGRHPDVGHGAQPRAGSGTAARAAHAVVSQHLARRC